MLYKRILPIAVVLALGVSSALAAQSSTPSQAATKPASSNTTKAKTHVAEGSVVASSDDALTLRSGKKDLTFKMNSTTQKPSSMSPGDNVKVNYHDEGIQHIANSIELVAPKSNATAGKSPTKK
jgi:hypothetical protein